MFRQVYLDYAASTPTAQEAFEAMLPYLRDKYGNASSTHARGRELRTAIEQARRQIAELIGASPAEIIFTSGGTEADNQALCAGYDHIVTSPLEHHAVLHAAQRMERLGLSQTRYLTPESDGSLSLQELETILDELRGKRVLVSLMHVNNEIGYVYDIEAFAEAAKARGADFHSDMVQSFGHFRAELNRSKVDYAAAAAHKFYGPKGVGFLYAKSPIAPLICGGAQERNVRAGTENVAGIMGMAAALKLTYERLEENENHYRKLRDYFWGKLKETFPGVRINGDPNRCMPATLNVAFPIEDDEPTLLMHLDIRGVCASGGSACSSGSVKPSHVLSAMGMSSKRIAASVRFSFGRETTIEDLDYVVECLRSIVGQPAWAR
ncbi:MAG: cysteine desulfurase [Bacteroidia bacterium]|nr:cysteine desulfurase [Bacteroidia bacterium]